MGRHGVAVCSVHIAVRPSSMDLELIFSDLARYSRVGSYQNAMAEVNLDDPDSSEAAIFPKGQQTMLYTHMQNRASIVFALEESRPIHGVSHVGKKRKQRWASLEKF